MSFRVGQKVVCVYDFEANRGNYINELLPVINEIYTIRALVKPNDPSCLLVEIVNRPQQYIDAFGEVYFRLSCFRPVDETYGEQVASELEKQLEPETVSA